MRSCPSAPDVQNHSFHGSSLGSGRVASAQYRPERKSTVPFAAGYDSVIPLLT